MVTQKLSGPNHVLRLPEGFHASKIAFINTSGSGEYFATKVLALLTSVYSD
jgi:hypothetical protein